MIYLYYRFNHRFFCNFSPERPDFTKAINDLQAANQWQPVQQTYFTRENLSNVNESPQDNQPHKARSLSDKGQWTNFSLKT